MKWVGGFHTTNDGNEFIGTYPEFERYMPWGSGPANTVQTAAISGTLVDILGNRLATACWDAEMSSRTAIYKDLRLVWSHGSNAELPAAPSIHILPIFWWNPRDWQGTSRLSFAEARKLSQCADRDLQSPLAANLDHVHVAPPLLYIGAPVPVIAITLPRGPRLSILKTVVIKLYLPSQKQEAD